jgi:hypothetical protein
MSDEEATDQYESALHEFCGFEGVGGLVTQEEEDDDDGPQLNARASFCNGGDSNENELSPDVIRANDDSVEFDGFGDFSGMASTDENADVAKNDFGAFSPFNSTGMETNTLDGPTSSEEIGGFAAFDTLDTESASEVNQTEPINNEDFGGFSPCENAPEEPTLEEPETTVIPPSNESDDFREFPAFDIESPEGIQSTTNTLTSNEPDDFGGFSAFDAVVHTEDNQANENDDLHERYDGFSAFDDQPVSTAEVNVSDTTTAVEADELVRVQEQADSVLTTDVNSSGTTNAGTADEIVSDKEQANSVYSEEIPPAFDVKQAIRAEAEQDVNTYASNSADEPRIDYGEVNSKDTFAQLAEEHGNSDANFDSANKQAESNEFGDFSDFSEAGGKHDVPMTNTHFSVDSALMQGNVEAFSTFDDTPDFGTQDNQSEPSSKIASNEVFVTDLNDIGVLSSLVEPADALESVASVDHPISEVNPVCANSDQGLHTLDQAISTFTGPSGDLEVPDSDENLALEAEDGDEFGDFAVCDGEVPTESFNKLPTSEQDADLEGDDFGGFASFDDAPVSAARDFESSAPDENTQLVETDEFGNFENSNAEIEHQNEPGTIASSDDEFGDFGDFEQVSSTPVCNEDAIISEASQAALNEKIRAMFESVFDCVGLGQVDSKENGYSKLPFDVTLRNVLVSVDVLFAISSLEILIVFCFAWYISLIYLLMIKRKQSSQPIEVKMD